MRNIARKTSRLKKFLFLLVTSVITFLATTAGAKPTLPFNLGTSLQFPSLKTFAPFQQYIEKRQAEASKRFTGRRFDSNSLRMVYYHDMTIAVVELGPEKLLLGCELIEVL